MIWGSSKRDVRLDAQEGWHLSVKRILQKADYLRWGSYNYNMFLSAFKSLGKGIFVKMEAKHGKS
jgi:hypothetical protein